MRSMVEGVSRLRGYPIQDGAEVVQHINGRNSQDSKTPFMKINVPAGIALRTVGAIVRFAIHFDHQLPLASEEIHNIGADRMLPANLETKFLAAKLLPQHRFRQAHVLAQLASSIDFRFAKRVSGRGMLGACLACGHPPSTTPFGRGPPPRAGEDHDCRSIHAAQAPFARSRTRPI